MAPRKFGTVRKTGEGKWSARYQYAGGKYSSPEPFVRESHAAAWLEKERALIRDGDWTPPTLRVAAEKAEEERKALTVRVWLADWLDKKEREGLKPSTMAKYRERLQRRVTGDDLPKSIREFAGLPVADVTATQARSWWSAVEDHWPDSGEMNSKAFQHVRSAFSYLVDDEVLPANPIVVKAARRKPKPKLERPLLEVEELTALYGQCPDRYKLVTALTLFHGLRIGEALALERRNVIMEMVPPADGGVGPDDLRIFVRVDDNVQRINGEMVSMGSPKTGAGVRTVPIFRAFLADIWVHLTTFTGPAPDDLVITTRTGKHVMDTSYRSVLNGMRERAGIDKRVHAHAGRRFITTALLEQGVEPQVVGEIIGDKDLTTVLEVYAQVRAGRTEEVMEKLGRNIRL